MTIIHMLAPSTKIQREMASHALPLMRGADFASHHVHTCYAIFMACRCSGRYDSAPSRDKKKKTNSIQLNNKEVSVVCRKQHYDMDAMMGIAPETESRG